MTDGFTEAMQERRRCSFCQHRFITQDADFRAVPQPPIENGMSVTMLMPLCPQCGKPAMVEVKDIGADLDPMGVE